MSSLEVINNIGVTPRLDNKLIVNAEKQCLKRIYFLEQDPNLRSTKVELVNATKFRIPGTVHAYQSIKKDVIQINKKRQKAFRLGKVDFSSAFPKEIFWTYMNRGILALALKENEEAAFGGFEVVPSAGLIDIFRVGKRYAQLLTEKLRKGQNHLPPFRAKYVFLISSQFQVQQWGELILSFSSDEAVLVINSADNSIFNSAKSRFIDYQILTPQFGMAELPNLDFRALFGKKTLRYYLEYLVHFPKVAQYVSLKKWLSDCGCKVLIVNAAENTGLPNAFSTAQTRQSVHLINSMNGIKAVSGNNCDANFDTWIIWDEQMKDVLVSGCKLEAKQFEVAGHLGQDYIPNSFERSNIDWLKISLESKRVISVFTSPTINEDKTLGLKALYDWLVDNKDVVLLLRKHPSEKLKQVILPEDKELLSRVIFVPDDLLSKKQTLYEQILVSNAAIVFASTVAIESKWCGVPCLTFEVAKESALYCVDNDLIFHANTQSAMHEWLDNYSNSQPVKLEHRNPVYKRYSEIIRSKA